MNTKHQLKSKIKISMICVSKEYEIKRKMVYTGAMTTAKNDVFIFYCVKLAFGGRE